MKSYVYILTDSNRTFLHVGITDDLENVAMAYKNGLPLVSLGFPTAVRLVYHEVLHSEQEALQRLRLLTSFTRMQKERLIRKSNPNWTDQSHAIGRGTHLLRDFYHGYQRYVG